MSLIAILIAYFFDYKSSKASFGKDLVSGLLLCLGFLISAIVFISIFKLHLIYGILFLGVEIILVFTLKAFIQNKSDR